MTPARIVAIVLIVAGALALAYGGFSYTKETHQAKLGPIELSMKEKENVNIPQWIGIAAIAAGIVVLVVGGRKGK
jgi:multidrug transporter EmrE-like cation transporter